jgi:hypothetical protein
MDDGIHTPDRVHLIRNASRLGRTAQIANDYAGGTGRKVIQTSSAVNGSRVQHHSLTLIKECLRRRPAEAVRAACNEYDRHLISPETYRTQLTARRVLCANCLATSQQGCLLDLP